MLSVVIITKNEEGMIETCLESVKLADELVIMDNGSSDKTKQIAKKYTDKVFEFNGHDFAALRNEAMKKIAGDWVLFVDADERVLEPLKQEILQITNTDDGKYSAYAVSRQNIIFGQAVSYGPYKHDWVIRLIKVNAFENWIGEVHEYVKFKGELGYLKNKLLHLTHRDLDHFMMKSLDWSKIDAGLRLKAGHPKMSGWRFLRILLSETFNQGILRKGFFNGTVGIIDSFLQVFHLYITYVRLWELQQKTSLEKIYKNIDEQLLKDNFRFSK